MAYSYFGLNNPGNIGYSPWTAAHGGTQSSGRDVDHYLAQFPDLQSGYNAMAALALSKYNSGLTSLSSLIGHPKNGWTPGNQAAVRNIAGYMRVDPNADLNLRDPASMAAFQRALTLQETGSTTQWDQYQANPATPAAYANQPQLTPAQQAANAEAGGGRTLAYNPQRPRSFMRGADVSALQQQLVSAGYDVGKDGADGVYGKDTANAVRQYQQANGLPANGVAGPRTLAALNPPSSGEPAAPPDAFFAAPVPTPAQQAIQNVTNPPGGTNVAPVSPRDYALGRVSPGGPVPAPVAAPATASVISPRTGLPVTPVPALGPGTTPADIGPAGMAQRVAAINPGLGRLGAGVPWSTAAGALGGVPTAPSAPVASAAPPAIPPASAAGGTPPAPVAPADEAYQSRASVPVMPGVGALPALPYGAEAVLKAQYNNDPKALAAATDTIKNNVIAQHGYMGALLHQDAIKKEITDALGQATLADPVLGNQIKDNVARNPALTRNADPAGLAAMNATFAKLRPVTPTGSIPLPLARPDYTPPPPADTAAPGGVPAAPGAPVTPQQEAMARANRGWSAVQGSMAPPPPGQIRHDIPDTWVRQPPDTLARRFANDFAPEPVPATAVPVTDITPAEYDPRQAPVRNLTVGMSGPDVMQVQSQLRALGFNPGAADGVYGPQTRAAVLRAQKAVDPKGYAGPNDGIAGLWTQGMLQRLAPPPTPPIRPVPADMMGPNTYGQPGGSVPVQPFSRSPAYGAAGGRDMRGYPGLTSGFVTGTFDPNTTTISPNVGGAGIPFSTVAATPPGPPVPAAGAAANAVPARSMMAGLIGPMPNPAADDNAGQNRLPSVAQPPGWGRIPFPQGGFTPVRPPEDVPANQPPDLGTVPTRPTDPRAFGYRQTLAQNQPTGGLGNILSGIGNLIVSPAEAAEAPATRPAIPPAVPAPAAAAAPSGGPVPVADATASVNPFDAAANAPAGAAALPGRASPGVVIMPATALPPAVGTIYNPMTGAGGGIDLATGQPLSSAAIPPSGGPPSGGPPSGNVPTPRVRPTDRIPAGLVPTAPITPQHFYSLIGGGAGSLLGPIGSIVGALLGRGLAGGAASVGTPYQGAKSADYGLASGTSSWGTPTYTAPGSAYSNSPFTPAGWTAPSFDTVSGGPTYAYHRDPNTGTVSWINSAGNVVTADSTSTTGAGAY